MYGLFLFNSLNFEWILFVFVQFTKFWVNWTKTKRKTDALRLFEKKALECSFCHYIIYITIILYYSDINSVISVEVKSLVQFIFVFYFFLSFYFSFFQALCLARNEFFNAFCARHPHGACWPTFSALLSSSLESMTAIDTSAKRSDCSA